MRTSDLQRRIVALSISLIWVTLSIASSSSSSSRANAQSTQPIADNDAGKRLIAVIVEAHGGAAALSEVRALRITLDATSATTEAKRHVVATVRFPDCIRQDMEITAAEPNAQPGHTLLVIGPNGGWTVQADPGSQSPTVTDLPAEALTSQRTSMLLNPIYVLQQASSGAFHFAVNGSEKIGRGDGVVDAIVLDIGGPEGIRMRWLVDPKSGEILQRVAGMGRVTYDEWQTIGGIRVPARTRMNSGESDAVMRMKIAYEINPKIDEHTFEKPITSTTRP